LTPQKNPQPQPSEWHYLFLPYLAWPGHAFAAIIRYRQLPQQEKFKDYETEKSGKWELEYSSPLINWEDPKLKIPIRIEVTI
jgi:hypothetical protein